MVTKSIVHLTDSTRNEDDTNKGEIPNAVMEKWQEIWAKNKELNRKYTADFEVYEENYQEGEKSEVKIFIAID